MKTFTILTALVFFTFSGIAQNLIPYLSGDKYGYADEEGNLIIQPNFSDAKIMTSGVGAVFNGEKWGAVNAEGKEILPFEFDEITPVLNGENSYLKTMQNGLHGLTSLTGKIIVPANYREVYFYNDVFLGCNKGACTLYTVSGKKINTIEAIAVIYDATQNILYAMDSKVVQFYNTKGKAFAEVKNFTTVEPLSVDFMVVKTENNMTIVSNQGILLEKENSFIEAKYIDKWAKAKTENGWGLANNLGWVLEPKYQDVKRINAQLLAAKTGGKWALFDWDGNAKTDFEYKRIDKIKGTDKFIKAYLATNWNLFYADGTPTEINNVYALNIKALGDEGIPFKQKLWGVTSLKSGEIIEPIYKKVFTTKSGNFIVELGDRYGVLSPKGKELIKPKYDKILEKDEVYLASLDYNYFIFDGNGKELLKQKEEWDKQDFMPVGFYRVKRDKKQGVINGEGEILIPVEYDKIDTLTSVFIAAISGNKFAFKYNGTKLFKEPYFGFRQKNEWIEVQKKANGYYLFGWYNLGKNNWFIEPKWKSLNAFNQGANIVVKTEKDLFGILDAQGNFVVEPAAEELLPLSENTAFYLEQTGGGYWLKSLDGKKVHEDVFEVINIWHGSDENMRLYSVIQNQQYGLMNESGEMILAADYNLISQKKREGESLFRINKGEKWGLITPAGKVVVEPIYNEITEVKEGWFLLEENAGDKKYLMNAQLLIFKDR